MYYYSLSEGCYSDYHEVTISHENKFTKREFVKMYNEALDKTTHSNDAIAEKMIEMFKFKEVKLECEINFEYGSMDKIEIDNKEIDEPHIFIQGYDRHEAYKDFRNKI